MGVWMRQDWPGWFSRCVTWCERGHYTVLSSFIFKILHNKKFKVSLCYFHRHIFVDVCDTKVTH